jgi:amino acid adenylation domain-containing protein
MPEQNRQGTIYWLDFNRCATELDSGFAPNHSRVAKLALDGNIMLALIEVLEELSQSLPGTITAIEPNLVRVSSISYEIALRQIQTLEGQPLSIPDLSKRFGLQIGYQFQGIDPQRVQQIEAFNSSIAKHEAFWVEKLGNLQPITIPYAAQTAFHSKKQFKSITIPVHDEIRSFLKGRNSNWNLGDFLCAAFIGYLARIGGTNSFDLGFRDIELAQELNNSAGFFAAYVPCHLEINLEQSFEEFFAAIRVQIELTKQHKTYARDTVVRYPTLREIPELASPDIFPVVIEWVEKIAEQQGNAGNELTLIISADETECLWLYNTEAFDANSITRMLEQFTIFLQGIATNSTQSLAHLPLLSEWERHKILVEWNDTAIDYPLDQCIHQLFEDQVEKTPNALAVLFKEQQLTYQELNERANQFAAYLQELGVEPETLVGIFVERSLEMIVANLAILKAGGAYLPLDSTYPQERLDYIIQDAQISLILTQNHLQAKISSCVTVSQNKIQIIPLDSNLPSTPTSLQSHKPNPSNLAYVIYTSGSTGKPKGVEIPHRALVNFAQAAVQEYEITQSDRILQFASISFDASIEEIYPCLIAGGTLVLRSEEMSYSPSLLLEKSCDYGITILDLPTAFWHLLTAELANNLQLQLPPSIRLVIIGGEAVNPKQVTIWNRLVETCQLINTYGPTETTVVATSYKIPHQLDHLSTIPIGRPLPNLQTYILDQNLHPVPVGVPGEIYIGGAGLARGYLNRPELTAEKFVVNPFAQGQKSKLYKTGDLARYLATLKDTASHNAKIEYLGRIDNQVKIRGFRIELGEIEATITLHQNIHQTVVIAKEDNSGDKRLVAYIVPHPEQTVTTEEIRGFLKEKLPQYMIPSTFIFIEALPLTTNGKIDHRALPAPEQARSEPEETFVAPRNQLELQLATIWQNVLGIQNIGIHDNFFDLGGQSLLAVRLFAEIHKSFNQKLTLSTILQASTIEQLAKAISQKEYLPDSSYLVPIQPHGSKIPFFCIHGAQGEVLFLKSLANHLSRDQPFYAIRSPGQNGETAPLTCIEEMAKLYIKEIKTIQPQGPYLLGGYSFGGLVAFEMARQFKEQGQEVSLLALLDCYAPESLKYLPLHNRFLQHFRNFLSIGPDYFFNKFKTLRTRIMYRLLKDETMKNNYFHHLTSTKYFYNLINEFPNYTVEDLKLWENLYKANLQASSNYIPSVYAGKITIFRVKTDPTKNFYQPVAKCGWSELSNQEIEVYDCTGDHYTFIEEPHVQSLARQLQSCLVSATEL